MIIEYKLDAGPHGMTIPAWVKDGGYYRDPDNFTLVGWTDDAPREFKLPVTVRVLNKASLNARVLDIHSRYTFADVDGEGMTTDEVNAMVSTWYDAWPTKP